ncbi:hypothetical protein C1645_811819 [Glomus cerebriforme]|uniref:Cryptic loci regulator 2 N-terminal domain-containing protein n=1 Tax=Glomus cerebriforme TaxID=658196 RepID=A0A397TR44_9GLOM|nr:hypothetical protein C1645_811819 [Glomus cerebriforme]
MYTFANVKVEPEGLTVTATDATSENFPTNNTPGTPDEEGRQSYYRPVEMREAKWDLYCNKLGAALARELKRANKKIVIHNDVLTDLPEGYRLFEHVKNYINEPKKRRTDTYLYGFGSIKFRSPAEFEDHLLWLASDQSTHCSCKYCFKDSTPRRKIQSTRSTPQGNQRTPQKSSSAVTPSLTPTTTPNQIIQAIQPISKGSIQWKPQKSSRAIAPSLAPATTPNQPFLYSKSKSQLPSDINHSSRNGEIVWIKTSLVLSENYLKELKKGKVKIEHWPGYVVERQKFSQILNIASSGPLIDNIYYKVQPLNMAGTQKASEEQIVPWLLLSSESLVEKIYKIRDDPDANQKTGSSTLMRIIDLFCSAYDTARKISKTYTPLDSYKYTLPPFFLSKIEDSKERQLLQEMENYTHYKTLCFGSEILKEDDYVRMNDVESKGDNIRIFKINTIYKNFDNKILFNGDIYLKAFAKGDMISWSRLNDEDKEYFIELKEISGRFYDKCPYINKSMEVNEAISFKERKELIEGQEKPDPSQSVVTKQTAKRSIHFEDLLDTPTKKLKIQNENTTSQQSQQQNNQQENDARENNDSNNDELDYMDVRDVQQKVDPIIISPTIPFLDESEDEITEEESSLFEMLSNNPENPQLTAR